jgi:hypothetical protein
MMPHETRAVSPGPDARSVRTANVEILQPPEDWVLLPPGDTTLTRRVKEAGPTWTVQEKVGRKTFSRGIWASQAVVDRVRTDLATERATPQDQKQREAGVRRRVRQQVGYVEDFRQAVLMDRVRPDGQRRECARQRLVLEAIAGLTPVVGSGSFNYGAKADFAEPFPDHEAADPLNSQR